MPAPLCAILQNDVMPQANDSIRTEQQFFLNLLREGPDAWRDGVFAQDNERAALAMKIYANNVNSARMTALDNQFSRTKELMEEDDFLKISRAYVLGDYAATASMAFLGREFPEYLQQRGCGDYIVDLAQLEWLWLECYYAADMPSLTEYELANMDEDSLLSAQVKAHPSLRILPWPHPKIAGFPEVTKQWENGNSCFALALCDNGKGVVIHVLNEEQYEFLDFILAQNNAILIADILVELDNQGRAENALPLILFTIKMGALVKI